MTPGGRVIGGTVLTVVVVAGVILGLPRLVQRPAPAPAPEPVASGAAEEAAAPAEPAPPEAAANVAAPEPEPEAREGAESADAAPAPAPPVRAPRFTQVRIEPDGLSLIAGLAAPGAKVDILLGDSVIASVTADTDGSFVELLVLEPVDGPRRLTLAAEGVEARSDAILIAPRLAPELDLLARADGIAGPDALFAPAAETGPGDEPGEDDDRPAAGHTAAPAADVPKPADAASQATDTPSAGDPSPATTTGEPSGTAEPDQAGPETTADETAPADPATGAAGVEAAAPEPSDAGRASETAALDATGTPEPAPIPPPPPEVAGGAPAAPSPSAPPEGNPAPPQVAIAQAPDAAVPDPLPPLDAPGAAAPDAPPQPEVGESATLAAAPATDTPPATLPVLMSGPDGVRLLQPALAPGADPEVLRTVALDTITYDDGGEVLISGRARGGRTVRLYIAGTEVLDAPVGPDGTWTGRLDPALAPGTYTLRVDELDAGGRVTSRIELPFLRETRETIAAAIEVDETGVAVRTIQPGNTLWAIAEERYGDGLAYVSVFEANRDRIRNPDLIYPGQVFRIPDLPAPE